MPCYLLVDIRLLRLLLLIWLLWLRFEFLLIVYLGFDAWVFVWIVCVDLVNDCLVVVDWFVLFVWCCWVFGVTFVVMMFLLIYLFAS